MIVDDFGNSPCSWMGSTCFFCRWDHVFETGFVDLVVLAPASFLHVFVFLALSPEKRHDKHDEMGQTPKIRTIPTFDNGGNGGAENTCPSFLCCFDTFLKINISDTSFPSPQPASSLVSPPLASPSFTLRKVMKSRRLQVWPISVPITIASTGTANFSNEVHDVAWILSLPKLQR